MNATHPTILLAAGGSAGHISPMLATAAELTRLYPKARILALGTAGGLETDLVPQAGIELLLIDKVPFPRKPGMKALRFPLAFARQVWRVRAMLTTHRVNAVAGFGGYVCPPAYIAAALSRVPIAIHEANKRPGLANVLGARWATAVTTAFEPADGVRSLPRAEVVGMPMRAQIASLDRDAAREAARKELGLDPHRPTLLVTGGSLGAQRLNEAVLAAMDALDALGIQVLHITGKGKAFDVHAAHYHQREYVSAMEVAYAAADFAITRSGAGTVAELAAVGLPALLVPLPIGNGEQALNGADMLEAGAARMVSDSDLTGEVITTTVRECLLQPEVLTRMSAAARAYGVRDAAHTLATRIGSLIPHLAHTSHASDSSETGEHAA